MEKAFVASKEEIVRLIKNGVFSFDPQLVTCLSPDYSNTGSHQSVARRVGDWCWLVESSATLLRLATVPLRERQLHVWRG